MAKVHNPIFRRSHLAPLLLACVFLAGCLRPNTRGAVLVYAATPSGIVASIEAARLGKKVLLIEPSQHVGGMASSGLGQTDWYELRAIGGLAEKFFEEVHSLNRSTGAGNDRDGLYYEPHVAEAAFNSMLEKYPNIEIVLGASLMTVQMSKTTIQSVTMSNGMTYQADEFIDASYEGDLMAAANVRYTVGRESTAQYGEALAGVQRAVIWDGIPVDPWIVPGDPSSGLLPHVQSDVLGEPGTADRGIMAYNYRLCLSKDRSNQIPFGPPVGYDPGEFEVLARRFAANPRANELTLSRVCNLYPLPNHKYDLNACTDETGVNSKYPDGSSSERQRIAAEIRRYDEALLYFLMTDSRVPPLIRNEMQTLGLCKDEFGDNGGWPRQLYVREARRMIGQYVITQHDVEGQAYVPDSIGFGGFQLDSHFVNQVAVGGSVRTEGYFGKLLKQVYPISYRALTPLPSQATNLLVSVAVSSSHVAFASIRVEPTFMIMGQAAGAAASLAIDKGTSVQNISYSDLSRTLSHDGQVLW